MSRLAALVLALLLSLGCSRSAPSVSGPGQSPSGESDQTATVRGKVLGWAPHISGVEIDPLDPPDDAKVEQWYVMVGYDVGEFVDAGSASCWFRRKPSLRVGQEVRITGTVAEKGAFSIVLTDCKAISH